VREKVRKFSKIPPNLAKMVGKPKERKKTLPYKEKER
jgi:hypothetical protein